MSHRRIDRASDRTAASLLAGALCLVLAGPVAAAPGFASLLKGTNFAALSEADLKGFINSVETTVSSQPDGTDVRWNADRSGSSALMRVVKSYTQDGHACRDVGGTTLVKAKTENFELKYCRDAAGRWRLASQTSP